MNSIKSDRSNQSNQSNQSNRSNRSSQVKIILIVDDEQDLREVMAEEFRMNGLQVLEAQSRAQALEMIGSQKVDVVLSDIRMPGGDGIELLADIKSKYPKGPPVYLMTGFSEYSENELTAKGAVAVFLKPIDPIQVFGEISRFFNSKL